MASFNLGRIKGDKGDTGARGAKGDKGDTGARGARGADGADGCTPVFSVGSTTTVSSSQNARVEIDSTDAENPVIDFYIPRGADGADAEGDMMTAVYDTNGKNTDVFDYCDDAVLLCMKKSGGSFSGETYAYPSSLSNMCIRNIGIGNTTPSSAATGDIFITRSDDSDKNLSQCATGGIVVINECGTDVPYIIADKDIHGEDTVTLIRKYARTETIRFDEAGNKDYLFSTVDIFLEGIAVRQLEKNVCENLISVGITNGEKRKMFLPSQSEITSVECFENAGQRVAKSGGSSGSNCAYWLRTPGGGSQNTAYVVSTSGTLAMEPTTYKRSCRPMIVLPSDFRVKSCVYDDGVAVRVAEKKYGLYVFESGEWKECAAWQQ